MHECDVLIVGGGPAGSSLAWSLRNSELSVTIMDRKSFPRDKVCAGWVTPEVIKELGVDLEAYGNERTLQPITGFRIAMLGRSQLETYYSGEPVSYGIRRIEFDHYLIQRCGANLLLGHELKSLYRDGRAWLVNGDIRAKLVVGAGGHFCPVGRMLGAWPEGSEQVVAAQEIEFEMTPGQRAACKVDAETPELFFTPELNGYGWVFRKGDYLNVGLGREDSQKLSSHVRVFREYLIDLGRIPPDIPAKFKGHAYLLYHHALREVTQEGVLLIGDSAGLAYPESGEGIRPAVESAFLAAQIIQEAQGDYSRENLSRYFNLVIQRFGKREPQDGLIERLPQGLKQWLAGPLMQTQWFVSKILVERWFLHRGLPPLTGG
ncbi:MAG: NAD(P)/FAD-dependent oxidoreductase [SAR324 cluster bacterium]|nr:NAD(P)/FAD-dependent oxidoreductase [SAR324 cluster bacterium]MCZ6728432.1 NAD(P)/FAD-dependent oxidoreductase [SAR324 cluster bacterium]